MDTLFLTELLLRVLQGSPSGLEEDVSGSKSVQDTFGGFRECVRHWGTTRRARQTRLDFLTRRHLATVRPRLQVPATAKTIKNENTIARTSSSCSQIPVKRF